MSRRISTAVFEACEPRQFLSASPLVDDAPAPARPIDSMIYEPHDTVRGQTLNEWSVKWWQWAYSYPVSNAAGEITNPLKDQTGALGRLGDVDGAFFLAGLIRVIEAPPGQPDVVRTIEVPSGTPIFFPVLNYNATQALGRGNNYDELNTYTNNIMALSKTTDGGSFAWAKVDGVDVPGLDAPLAENSFRVESDLYEVTLPDNNVLGKPAQTTIAVSDGFWVMLKPMSLGQHTIQFGGGYPAINFQLNIQYNITVVPKGLYEQGRQLPSSSVNVNPGKPAAQPAAAQQAFSAKPIENLFADAPGVF